MNSRIQFCSNSLERRRAEEQGGEEQRADRNRVQVPADADSPPRRATQQIRDPLLGRPWRQ